jgi:hypothetical protein
MSEKLSTSFSGTSKKLSSPGSKTSISSPEK